MPMDDLQRVAQALATRISRAIAIDDPQMNLITHTAHDNRVDAHRVASVMQMRAPDEVVAHAYAQGIATAEGPVPVPALPEIDLLARVCIPVRCQGLLFGYLWIIDPDGSLRGDELAAACEAAAEAGQVLYRERLLDDLRDSRERELLRDLLSDDPAVSGAAAGLLIEEEMLPAECFAAVVEIQVPAHADSATAARTTTDAVLAEPPGTRTHSSGWRCRVPAAEGCCCSPGAGRRDRPTCAGWRSRSATSWRSNSGPIPLASASARSSPGRNAPRCRLAAPARR